MRKIIEYEVATGDDGYEITAMVHNFLKESYQPLGPLQTFTEAIDKEGHYVVWFYQVMVKYEEEQANGN